MNRGKLVIVIMLTVGILLASFAWWNRWSRSQQVLDRWGPEAATTIRTGETVELLLVATGPFEVGDAEQETLHIDAHPWGIRQVVDISQAKGLIHARHQLIQKEAFAWNTPRAPGCDPKWSHALRFRLGQKVSTVVFDFDCQRALLLEQDREVGMSPIADGMRTFLAGLPSDPSAITSADATTPASPAATP